MSNSITNANTNTNINTNANINTTTTVTLALAQNAVAALSSAMGTLVVTFVVTALALVTMTTTMTSQAFAQDPEIGVYVGPTTSGSNNLVVNSYESNPFYIVFRTMDGSPIASNITVNWRILQPDAIELASLGAAVASGGSVAGSAIEIGQWDTAVSDNGTARLIAGNAGLYVRVDRKIDTRDNQARRIIVELLPGTGYTIGKANATIASQDNDPSISINMTETEYTEGEAIVVNFVASAGSVLALNAVPITPIDPSQVRLNHTVRVRVTDPLGLVGGTRRLNATLLAGTNNVNVTLIARDDAVPNNGGNFTIALDTPLVTSGYTNRVPTSMMVAVKDDDVRFSISPSNLTIVEGETAQLNFTLNAVLDEVFSIAYDTEEGTAWKGVDYAESFGVIDLLPGNTSEVVEIASFDDSVYAGAGATKRFIVTANAVINGELHYANATVTIVDDDAEPLLSLSAPESMTPGENATFVISSGATGFNSAREIRAEIGGMNGVEAMYTDNTNLLPTPSPSPIAVQMNGTSNDTSIISMTLSAGERSMNFTIQAKADAKDPISVRLLEGDNYTLDPDLANQQAVVIMLQQQQPQSPAEAASMLAAAEINTAILPQVALTMADETGQAIADRHHNLGVTIDGQDVRSFAVDFANREAAREAAENPWDAPDALDAKSRLVGMPEVGDLAVTLPLTSHGEKGSIGLWAQGFSSTIDGEEGNVVFDGDIPGAIFGVDAQVSDRFMVGISRSQAKAEFAYAMAANTTANASRGSHETDLVATHPYFTYRLENGGSVWGTIGIGDGEITISEADADGNPTNATAYTSEVETESLGLGFAVQPNAQHEYLTIHGDVTRTSIEETPTEATRTHFANAEAEAVDLAQTRVRLGARFTHRQDLASGNGTAHQSLDVAVRHDAGDTIEGTAMELGGGIGVAFKHGLRLDLTARTLLFDDDVEEWGVRGGFVWVAQPQHAGQGLQVTLAPTWGNTQSQADAVLGGGIASFDASDVQTTTQAESHYAFDVRYGIPLEGEGLLTSFVMGDAGDVGATTYGSQYSFGGFATGVEVTADDSQGTAFVRYSREF